MAGRIRTIKPELLDDEKAAALSDAAWRLFVSSWLLADDHGRFRAGARYLAAQVWQDTGREAVAAQALAELAQAGRIRAYKVGGDTYAEIPTWARHQRIDNAGRERIPRPEDGRFIDFNDLDAVSPRTSANLREPPRTSASASEVAALPPTTDLGPPINGPPTTTRADARVESDPPVAQESDPGTCAPELPAPRVLPQRVPMPEGFTTWHDVARHLCDGGDAWVGRLLEQERENAAGKVFWTEGRRRALLKILTKPAQPTRYPITAGQPPSSEWKAAGRVLPPRPTGPT